MDRTYYLPDKGVLTRFALLLICLGCIFGWFAYQGLLFENQFNMEFFTLVGIEMFAMGGLFYFIDKKWC